MGIKHKNKQSSAQIAPQVNLYINFYQKVTTILVDSMLYTFQPICECYIPFNPYVNTPKHFCSRFWETVPKEIFQAPSLEILGGCKVSRLDPQQVTSSAQPFQVSLSLFAPIFPKYLSPLCTLNTYTPQRLCAKYIQQFYAQSKDYCARSHCLREQSETDIRLDPYRVDLPYMVNTTVKSTEAKELKENTVYNLWSQQQGLPLIYAERGHLAHVTINLRLDKAGSSEKKVFGVF